RSRGRKRARSAPDHGQLLNPRDSRGEGVVEEAPTLPRALHPDDSSWLNLVERFFAEITGKRIQRGIFANWQSSRRRSTTISCVATLLQSLKCGSRPPTKSSTKSAAPSINSKP